MDFFSLTTPNLPLVAVLIGLLLTATHLLGLIAPEQAMAWALNLPRSRFWGTTLLAVAAVWTLLIVATTDLGEFSPMRNLILLGVIASSVLLWKFVPDFLASRSIGFLLLLAAHPVLDTTFLQTGLLKMALVLLAYAWALAGLFLVGMPYLQRDAIAWFCAAPWRWKAGCWPGLIYGLLLLIDGVRMSFLN
jgi:hypothetical protein